jgi:DNA polymerase-3 subunit gamma/tau
VSVEEQPQDQQRSLYRRHRPRTFAEVVGQEPVVRTLRNAVQRGKVHHAYLFVGSRGTGKTSMAKILAACLNCDRNSTHPTPEDPTIEPCGECDSCVSIARATSLDVIEMDAASNNSVDDIRELRDSVAYAPVSGRRKVYILDEAHMLSTAAWNAFLKTLEEPPPNTVFVLATTEANKVPATVVDRCHRFDFHRPTVEQIASVVRRAAQAESIEIPPAAVAALARAATGSFRDALGTLEQIVTYSGAEIALEDVLAVLGVADARLLEAVVDAVAAGDAAAALRTLEECVEQGRDGASFAADLEVRARELLVVQVLGEVPPELSLTPEADAALSAQAQRVDHATVVRLLELLGAAMEGVRAGADARTRLELALVKAARPETDSSMRALLARIERLEGGGVRPNSAAPAAVTTPVATPPAAPAATTSPAPVATTPPAATTPAAVAPSAEPTTSMAATTPSVAEPTPPVAVSLPAPDDAGARGETQPSRPEPPPEQVPRDIESLYALWPAVVDLVRSEHALLGAVIGEARPVAVDGEELTLAYPFTAEFYKKKAEDPANRVAVGEALGTLAGGRWRLRYELRETPASEENELTQERSEEEWIARFVDEFDAEELTDTEDAVPGGGSAREGDGDAREGDGDARDDDERGALPATTGNEKGA